MHSLFRPITYFVLLGCLVAYAVILLRGPQGLSALSEKRRAVQALEEENANLLREIQLKKDRIERLKKDPATQELEVRKQLKLQRPGETSFILPDRPNPEQQSAQP